MPRCTIKVGNLTGGSVTYSNNLEKIGTNRDSELAEAADPTITPLTERNDVRNADTKLIGLAVGGTPVDLDLAYTLSAQAKLAMTAHEVHLQKSIAGGLQASFGFRGARNDVAARMLTAGSSAGSTVPVGPIAKVSLEPLGGSAPSASMSAKASRTEADQASRRSRVH